MAKPGKPPPIPAKRSGTVRQELAALLAEQPLPISTLSKRLGRSEKELYDHLEHIRQSGALRIVPARCGQCDYRFTTRERAKKPGKCPQCRSSRIEEPLFSIQRHA